MAIRIWPTENDVHDVAGGGKKPTEANLTAFRNSAAAQYSFYRDSGFGDEQISAGGVLSGFDFSSGDATSVILTAGTATIEGYYINDTATISGTLVASSFNYVFLTIEKTAALVDALSLTVIDVATFNSAVAPPSDPSILLWCFETDGSSIVNQYDFRTVGSNVISGHYIGDGAGSRSFDLGFRPKMVYVYHNETDIFEAHSPSPIPRQTGANEGLFIGQVGNAQAVTIRTLDPELVPIILEDGFSVEDGPAGVPAPIPLVYSETFDPPSTAGGATWSRIVTIPGAFSIGSFVLADFGPANFYGPQDWIYVGGSVTAVDTVTVTFQNQTGGVRDLGSGTLTVYVYELAATLMPWSLNELNKFYFFNAWY